MAGTVTGNVFDDLSVALTTQIEKLQSIDPRDKDRMGMCIEQSKAVAALADNVNRNTRNAIECVKLQHEIAQTSGDLILATPKLLKGSNDA